MVDGRSSESEPPYVYECVECGYRVERNHQPVECPECGEEMRNLSIPSE